MIDTHEYYYETRLEFEDSFFRKYDIYLIYILITLTIHYKKEKLLRIYENLQKNAILKACEIYNKRLK